MDANLLSVIQEKLRSVMPKRKGDNVSSLVAEVRQSILDGELSEGDVIQVIREECIRRMDASIKSIFIVSRSLGEDAGDYLVCAYFSRELADDHASRAQESAKDLQFTWLSGGILSDHPNPFDPQFTNDNVGSGIIYFVEELVLFGETESVMYQLVHTGEGWHSLDSVGVTLK